MKKYLAAVAFAAALAQPAAAITFSKLTTIYIASGVFDDGGDDQAGFATSVHCSNVSGQTAQIRFLILGVDGGVEAAHTFTPVPHGQTVTASTHETWFQEGPLHTGAVAQGVVNVESTQSGVFCTAMIVEAVPGRLYGIPLHMVRVNSHPGAVE